MKPRVLLSGLALSLCLQAALLTLCGLSACDDSLPPGPGQIVQNPPQSYQPVFTAAPTSPFPETSPFGSESPFPATPLPTSPFPNSSPFPATPPPASPFPLDGSSGGSY